MRLFFYILLFIAEPVFLTINIHAQDEIRYNIIVEKPEKENANIRFELIIEPEDGDRQKFETLSVDTFIQLLVKDITRLPDSKNNVLCYIHGMWGGNRYNFNHAMGLMTSSYLDHKDSDIGRILSVKWPGNSLEYKDNKARVYKIADELSEVLVHVIRSVQLADLFTPKFNMDFDLMAHSLGNELFKEVLINMDKKEFQYRLFDQIILAAPDLDVHLLNPGEDLSRLKDAATRSHIYFSRKDMTLTVSKNLNKKDRLGVIGPVEDSNIADNIYFVDVSNVKDESNIGERISGHSYYRSSQIATSDMLYTLIGLQNGNFSNRTLVDNKKNIFAIEAN